jgi:hypothetical protein
MLAVPVPLAVLAVVVMVVPVVVLALVLAVAGHHHLAVLPVHLTLQAAPEGGVALVGPLPPANRGVVMHVPAPTWGRWQFLTITI